MPNPQFDISYNGHRVAVTILDKDLYYVQITYKPVEVQLVRNNNGTENWIEKETREQSFLANEIGRLINERLYCTA